MKIIRIDRVDERLLGGLRSAVRGQQSEVGGQQSADWGLRYRLMADSSWRPDKRPLFVDERVGRECEIRAAIVINRLGKNVPMKYGERYMSRFVIVNYTRYRFGGLLGDMRDDSLVVGDSVPFFESVNERIKVNGIEVWLKIDLGRVSAEFCRLSEGTTFKTGDLIILPEVLFEYVPRAGREVTVEYKDKVVLNFKIK